ncbi:histidine kinase, partial [Xanthomonas citri pv. citri]
LQTQWGELLVKPRHHHGKGIRKQPQPTNSATSQKPSPVNRIRLLDEQNWQNFADSQEPSFDENELLNTLANLIGLMFAGQKQREQEHQLILSEERNTMARELHDSLAQSLSYLKMQVSMLTTLLKDNQNPNNHKIEQVLSQTKDGLNGA